MADVIEKTENQEQARRGPGRPRKHPIRTAKYHIYEERKDGSLNHLGEAEARNAELAATDFFKGHEDKLDGQAFLVVPNRNISRIHAKVETTKRVRVSST
jgi:hypothetical protein